MAKRRKRKKSKSSFPEIERILRGEIRLTPLELVRLIHKINPSGEKLSPARRSERYRLKARLQSLLVREHGDSLLVGQEEGAGPDVISLRLRYFDEDACHALLPELDDDARSQVRRMLDEQGLDGDAGSASVSNRGEPSGPVEEGDTADDPDVYRYTTAELVTRARRLLDEYDYQGCERFLPQACSQAGGDPTPWEALLELYIDHLAAYDRALDVAKGIPARLRQEERIRGLLALAHARLDQPEQAMALLTKKLPARGSEACLYAGLAFAGRGDVEQAAACYHRLQTRDLPDLQDLVLDLGKRIEQLRAEENRPEIEKMEQAYAEGDLDLALELATGLLQRDPSRREAERIRDRCLQQRQQEKAARLLARADAARERGDYRREVELLRRAMDEQGLDRAMEQRLRRAVQKAGEQEAQEEAADVLRLLDQGRTREALLRFCGLPEKYRREVAASSDCVLLAPMLQLLQAKGTFKPGKLVEAIMALAAAQDLLESEDDPGAALALLDAHARGLVPVSAAGRLRRRAEARRQELARRRIAVLFDAARQAMREKRSDALRQSLDSLAGSELSMAEKERLRELQQVLHELERKEELEKRYAAACSLGDHLAARRLAGELSTVCGSGDTATWQDRGEAHDRAIRRQWRLESFSMDNLAPAYHFFFIFRVTEDRRAVLRADGAQAVVACSFDRLLALYCIDVPGQRLERVVTLCTPHPLEFPQVQADGNTLWITGQKGYALQVSPDGPDILAWHDYTDFLQQGEVLDELFLFPDQGHVWLSIRNRSRQETIVVLNMKTWQVERRFPSRGLAMALRHRDRVEIAEQPFFSGEVRFFVPRGRMTGRLMITGEEDVLSCAAFHPDGRRYLFCMRSETENDYLVSAASMGQAKVEERSALRCFAPEGGEVMEALSPDEDFGEIAALHVAHDSGYAVLCGFGAWGENKVWVCRVTEACLEEQFLVTLPEHYLVVQDEFSRQVVLLLPQDDGLRVVQPGPEPPAVSGNGKIRSMPDDIPAVSSLMECGDPTGPEKAKLLAQSAYLGSLSSEGVMEEIKRTKASGDPDNVALLLQALREVSFPFDTVYALDKWFAKEYPRHPLVRIERAERRLREGNFSIALELLADLPLDRDNEGVSCHVCHLLGLGYLGLGDVSRAIAVLEQGAAMERGSCKLEPLLDYAMVCRELGASGGDPFSGTPAPELALLFQQVDEALACQEYGAVVSRLEGYSFANGIDFQLLARFAEAYLGLSTRRQGERGFGKQLIFSWYCEQYMQRPDLRKCRLLAPLVAVWPDERLKEIYARVQQWLGAGQDPGEQK